jgi:hypothetical protein
MDHQSVAWKLTQQQPQYENMRFSKPKRRQQKHNSPEDGGVHNSRSTGSSSRRQEKEAIVEDDAASDESSASSDSSSDLGDGFSSSSEEFEDSSSSDDEFDDGGGGAQGAPSIDQPVRRVNNVRFRDYYDISGKVCRKLCSIPLPFEDGSWVYHRLSHYSSAHSSNG